MNLTETRLDIRNRIAFVTLRRPEHMNAFTPTMGVELEAILEEADRNDEIRAVIITGEGKAFCAGADLSLGAATFNVPERSGREVLINEHRDEGGKVAMAIWNCRKPVIGALNGHAVGVGITMTLAMDMRIVAADAKIGFVFARRGVAPEACSSWFLPRLVGMPKAAELIYTGRVFVAADEAGSGLFNYVLPREEVLKKATEIATEIVENTSAVSVTLSKTLLKLGAGAADPGVTHIVDSRYFFWAGFQRDAAEGVMSFLEKRRPNFTMSPTRDLPDFYPQPFATDKDRE